MLAIPASDVCCSEVITKPRCCSFGHAGSFCRTESVADRKVRSIKLRHSAMNPKSIPDEYLGGTVIQRDFKFLKMSNFSFNSVIE